MWSIYLLSSEGLCIVTGCQTVVLIYFLCGPEVADWRKLMMIKSS